MLLLAGAQVAVPAQPNDREHDPSPQGIMSLAELRQEPIQFELNIPYAATENPSQRLDLYLPEEPGSDELPVIVFFHGGGWRQGDKADCAERLMPFVRGGQYAGVAVGYRLSGEAIWPAQIHDCKAAIRWVRANAKKYGLDPNRIGVWGRSAGGHLALMLGVSGDVPELEGDLGPNLGMSSKITCVANYSGVSEFLALCGQESIIDRTKANAPEAKLIGGLLGANPEKAKAASPLTYVSPDDPPVLTAHGSADSIVPYDQAVRLDKALRKAGVRSYFIKVKGAGHGGFPRAVDERLAKFFAKYLLGKNVKISTKTVPAFVTF
jgi:acetyl esterase/lipase